MAPRVARLSRIGAGLMFGPPGHATRLHGLSGAPSGPDGGPAAWRRHLPADFHRRPPVWAARHSYRRRPGLLVALMFGSGQHGLVPSMLAQAAPPLPVSHAQSAQAG